MTFTDYLHGPSIGDILVITSTANLPLLSTSSNHMQTSATYHNILIRTMLWYVETAPRRVSDRPEEGGDGATL